jgi:hypothetical protein
MGKSALFQVDSERLSRLSAPLILLEGDRMLAASAGARPHLPRLLAAARDALPAPAAPWLAAVAETGEAQEAADPAGAASGEAGGLRVQLLARAVPDPAAPDEPSACLCSLVVQETAVAKRGLDSRLAGLLDSARFIAMGELVDALEHRLNQPRATLRNRLAILEAVQRQEPERAPDVLAQAYGDLQGLFEALAAFRAELTERAAHAREDERA